MEKWMILSAMCLLSCLHLSVIAQSSNSIAWTPQLLPDDPKVIVGQPLIMTCGLTCNCSTCPPRRCVENLIFHISRKFPQMAPLIISRSHPSFATLNATHAQLNMSDVHSEFDHAVVSCYPRGYENRYNDAQILRVGHLPSTPKIYYYRVLNWGKFVFKWRNILHIHNMVYPALYRSWFKPPGDSDFISCLQCSGVKQDCPRQVTRNNSGSCTIKHVLDLVHPSGHMQFKVNATNLFGRVVSEPELMSVDLYYHVEPATVKNLEILLSGINASRVSFTSPMFGYHLTYNLTVICGSTYAESWTINTKASKYTQSLTDLPRYTNCSVSVSCKPLYADRIYGYWSESVVKNFVS